MKLTPEQLAKLVEGLQTHDFTQDVYLPGGMENPEDEPERKYNPLESHVRSYMKQNLPDLGFTRNMDNFSEEHPVNVLISADARYIADEAMKILEDEKETEAALDEFFEKFDPLITHATASYCQAYGKTVDELDKDDSVHIIDHVTSTVNPELINTLMQGQQFPTLNNVAHKHLTHEDFGAKRNFDATNFYKQWTRCDTIVQEMLSLDDETLDIRTSIEPDLISQILFDDFCKTLNNVDSTIFRMRLDNHTYTQIAEALGYKNHSAVLKRVKKIKDRWTEFTSEIKPQP